MKKTFEPLPFLKENIRTFLVGGVVGVANIIPGVSGGTMAVIFGIYNYLMEALGNFLTNKEKRWQYIRFLVILFLGAIISIVALAGVLEWGITYYPMPTLYLFFGLIVGSIPVVIRSTPDMKPKPARIIALLIGLIVVVGISLLHQSQDASVPESMALSEFESKILSHIDDPEKATQLITTYYTKNETNATYTLLEPLNIESEKEIKKIIYGTKEVQADFLMYLFFGLCGAIAASAMIIPGVSGSFIMLLLGIYWTVVSSINIIKDTLLGGGSMDAVFMQAGGLLAALGVGIIIGILIISRFISWCLKTAPSITMYAIIGLIIGSFYTLLFLLFKYSPGFSLDGLGLISIAMFAIGLVLSLVFGKKPKEDQPDDVQTE